MNRKNAGLLRTLMNSIPDMFIFKDGEGRWLESNETALRLFRIDEMDYKGKKDNDLAELRPFFKDTFFNCMATDEQAWQEGEAITYEAVIPQYGGGSKVFEVTKVPVFHRKGRRKLLAVFGRDITKRKSDEESQMLTSRMFENMNEGVIITDKFGNIQSVNPAFIHLTGYSFNEVIHKNPRILRSGKHGNAFYKTMWDTVLEKGNWQGEIWNRRKNGELYLEWISLSSILNDKGEITNYLAVFRDITEREEIQKEVILTGEIQKKWLPDETKNDYFTIKTLFRPSNYVSGDFFGYIWNSKKKLLFGYIIDIMGHGLATALQTSALRVLFHQAAQKNLSLADKLVWINKETVNYFSEDIFAAAICFEFDFHRQEMNYATGGINCFFVLYDQRLEQVKRKGAFIGLREQEIYKQHTIPFRNGDSFYFFSDGLFDALPGDFLAGCTEFETVVSKLEQFVGNGTKRDDASALCVKINGKKPLQEIKEKLGCVGPDPGQFTVHFIGMDDYKQYRDFIGEWIRKILPGHHSLVEVGMNEAVNNAFKHGSRNKSIVSVKMKIRVLNSKRLVIRIKDQGEGFAGNRKVAELANQHALEPKLTEESGRGLFLMSQAFDQMKYNAKGNEVMLVKKIPVQ